MDIETKLEILADSAKYDVSCASSGSTRSNQKGMLGNGHKMGICHSFSADGRCISLLKVLLTNACAYDCSYCINRKSNDIRRAAFTPRELADLTIEFYRRNYIEGLFLSSAIPKSPDNTMQKMYECLHILRNEYHFNGYIHAKVIPGASQELINLVGSLADRVSVNLELPSEKSLTQLAPDKSRKAILGSMGNITKQIQQNRQEIIPYKKQRLFIPAGQSTQMIIGASPENDWQIMQLAEGLYQKYGLKRVYYSAYLPIGTSSLLPAPHTPVPLLREHRLYQADWLLRFYGFSANELFSKTMPNLDLHLDPKCQWALQHYEQFPVEINKANYYTLLRVPGIGMTSAQKIITARRQTTLQFADLQKMRISMKRAAYFIICDGKTFDGITFNQQFAYNNFTLDDRLHPQHKLSPQQQTQQGLFDDSSPLNLLTIPSI